jgi:hypothetical protein
MSDPVSDLAYADALWKSADALRDAHPDLKADFILANPPFNVSDWSGQLLRGDKCFAFGDPPVGNANYAWIQHFIHHLDYPNGRGGGAEDIEEDAEPFTEQYPRLLAELEAHFQESERLTAVIRERLKGVVP